MPARDEDFTTWESLWERIDLLAAALSRYKARNVNASRLRHEEPDIVLGYFREVKPALQRLGVTDASVKALESEMQRLIGLAAGKNGKASYQKVVRNIR